MDAKREELTTAELERAVKEMVRVRDKEGSDIAKLGEPSFVARQLFEMSQRGQVVKFYNGGVFVGLMVFDVGRLWWLEKPILIEQLVLSCDRKNSAGLQREAIRALDALAKYNYPFVTAIASGSLFMRQPQIVMNAYRKAGFTQTAPTAIKILGEGEGNGASGR